MRRKHQDFHDGAKDGLTPLAPLDINRVQDFDEMLAAMGRTAFGGRTLGEAAEVLTEMIRDPESVGRESEAHPAICPWPT